MQHGKMMTGIADACSEISALFERVQKKLKTEGLFNEKEHAFIQNGFNEMLKEGSQCLEQLRKFFSLKQSLEETEKTKLLHQMHVTMKAHHTTAIKFEKGFVLLSKERLQRLEDTKEVEQLFKVRVKQKDVPVEKEKKVQPVK